MFYRSKHELIAVFKNGTLQGRHIETGLSFGETETRPCRETGLDAALGPSRRRAQEERAAISLNGSLSSAQKRKYKKLKEDDDDLAAAMRRGSLPQHIRPLLPNARGPTRHISLGCDLRNARKAPAQSGSIQIERTRQ